MVRSLPVVLTVLTMSAAALAQPPIYREATIVAIRSNPDRFHRQWVIVTGSVTRERNRTIVAADGASLRLVAAAPPEDGEVEVRGQILDVGRLQRNDPGIVLPGTTPSLSDLYPDWWPARGEEIVLSATSVTKVERQIVEVPGPPLPLEVYFSAPIEGETDVRLDARIRIQFSRDVEAASLNARIRVTYSQSDSVERGEPQPPSIALTTMYNPGSRSVEISPSQPLERFRQVKVELLAGIVGSDGSVLRPWTLSFSTGGS